MPIGVRVVSVEQYGKWLAAAADDVEAANAELMAAIESGQNASVKLAANEAKKVEE